MLFLLRPPQTWMSYGRPRTQMEQDAYYDQVRGAYSSTLRVPPYDPSRVEAPSDDLVTRLKDLADLHRSGALTDEEFAAAKDGLLRAGDSVT